MVGKKNREYEGVPRGQSKKNREHKFHENENFVYNPSGLTNYMSI